MVAAVEIYNKPGFPYRTETFAILAINGWELLLKAKWLVEHNNNPRSLFVMEPLKKKDGTKSKKFGIKTSRSGNPLTHGVDHLAKKLVETGILGDQARVNIHALTEFRDSAIHFYHKAPDLQVRIQALGAACLNNFILASRKWFARELTEFDLFLMPLSTIVLPTSARGMVLNQEEARFIEYLASLPRSEGVPGRDYAVTVGFEVKLSRSKTEGVPIFRSVADPNALPVYLSDEQIRDVYPWDYQQLTTKCRKTFGDFKIDMKYHRIRKELESDERFAKVRYLDPEKPKSQKKTFFNPNIMREFSKHYTKNTGV